MRVYRGLFKIKGSQSVPPKLLLQKLERGWLLRLNKKHGFLLYQCNIPQADGDSISEVTQEESLIQSLTLRFIFFPPPMKMKMLHFTSM